jgi:hypothetical protein
VLAVDVGELAWCKAAAEVTQGRCKRCGFITTNSIHQTFNRRVIEPFLLGRDTQG